MQLIAIVAPSVVPRRPTELSQRELEEVDRFVATLGGLLGVRIPVLEKGLRDAPSAGLIITFDGGVRSNADLGPRTIAMNLRRSDVPALLEELQLCAAVESHRYFQWRTSPDSERGYGVFGRRDVATRIGASFGKDAGYPPETKSYGILASDDCADLPSLMARYLRAYAELRPALTGTSGAASSGA